MIRPPTGTLVVAALVALGATLTPQGAARAPRPVVAAPVEVVGSSAVCPDLRQLTGVLASRTSVGVGPAPAGRQPGPGTVGARRVTGQGDAVPVPVASPGQVAVGIGTTIDRDGLVVSAAGSLAAGLEAEQVTRGEQGVDRGLAGLRCEPPRPEAWFEGGSTLVGDGTVLVLADVDDTPSLVDVVVDTGTGPADPRPGQGLTVEPHSRIVVNLDQLAPDRGLLAVHVISRRGRVAAGLRHARALGRVPLGVDWVPQATTPATRVVVPGFPQGPGARSILVTNPGTDDTTVHLQVTGASGQFVPTGLDAIQVPAGTTVARRLDRITDVSALAVTVVSDGAAVLAGGVVVDRQLGPVREFSYTGGSEPLSGPALVTDLVINKPTESTLILSAPAAAASVVVTPLRVLGAVGTPPAPVTVAVPAGRTTSLRLSTFFPAGASAQLALEVRPLAGGGPVYAARYLRERGSRGPLTTLLDLRGPAQLVARPAVLRDVAVGAG